MQVDLFATYLNNQLNTFVIPCPDGRAYAIDALSIDWNIWDHLYLFPPRAMILKALNKLEQSKFKTAILVTRDVETSLLLLHLLKMTLRLVTTMRTRLTQSVGERKLWENRVSTLHIWRLSKLQTRTSIHFAVDPQ